MEKRVGLDGIVIVGPAGIEKSPMWSKMWQRAGFDPSVAARHFRPIYNGLGDVTITLGEAALRYATGEESLFRWHGRQVVKNGKIIYPTLDPTLLLPRRGDDEDDDDGLGLNHNPPRFQGSWVWDIHHALKWNTVVKLLPSTAQYMIDPPKHLWEQYVHTTLGSGKRLFFDIETAYKMKEMDDEAWESSGLTSGQMLRISFCTDVGMAVSVFWGQPYLDGIRALLGSDLAKGCWNGAMFDVPRLEEEGYHVGGRIYDYQDGWHLVQSDLPKGLEWVSGRRSHFLPWKHLAGANPGLYSCIDADVNLQIAINVDQDLLDLNLMDKFERHVTDLMPILKRAGKRGNMIDVQYSHQLEDEMMIHKIQLEKDAQNLIPRELKPRKRVKREKPEGDHDVVKVKAIKNVCSHCGEVVSNKTEHFKGGKKNNACKAASAVLQEQEVEIEEWDLVLDWNPNSSSQLKEYVKYCKHPMGKNRVTNNESVGTKHLDKLIKKYRKTHPIYPLVSEYKKVAKTISTYVYHNYMDSQELIHSTYVNGPSTWRLAAKNINLTNVGKRETNPWAVRARRQIISRPGHMFVGADSTSIEAVIVGYLINDSDFVKMAGKSIHAWLCCQELGWEFNDETMEKVKIEYKDLYNKMKTAIYLLLYGGDPYLMHMDNPESFPSLKDAQMVQEKIFNLLPKLKNWQEQQRELAKKEGVLTSIYGYRHHFYDVYTFKRSLETGKIEYWDDGRPKIKLGKDAKRCLAFGPQNAAAGFGRDTLLLIGQSQWGQWMPANVFVHDGYTLEVPDALVMEAEQFLVDTLTRPVSELGGLRIGCETEIGRNWAPVDSIDKKTGKFKFWEDGNPDGMKVVRKVECENDSSVNIT